MVYTNSYFTLIMICIAWTRDDINEFETMGIDLLWTELDEYGFVTRELGFDIEGRVIHKVPFGSKRFGLFDLQIITVSGATPFIEPERFNERWNEPDNQSPEDRT